MSRKNSGVQRKRVEEVLLHPSLAGAATALSDLRARGLFAVLPNLIHVVREGGFDVVDAVIFLLVRFFYGVVALKDVYKTARLGKAGRVLGALAGRDRLMSTSPLSEVLALVKPEQVRAITHEMLLVHSGAIEVLRHPWTQVRDTTGRGWHMVVLDGTRDGLRQRAPEQGEDLDPIRRRALELGKPGFLGHKRGDIVVHRSALQHASGPWLDVRVAPGNGDKPAEIASALQATGRMCEALDHPMSRVIMVADGEYGYVPDMHAFRDAGIGYLSRLSRYTLLDQPDIRERMNQGVWRFAPDGRSGPRRSALDLGLVTLHAGEDTKRPDGSPYEPITVRVVVTRTRCEESTEESDKKRKKRKKADHGRVINGWRYELFVAIGLDADAWPAPELVQLYFERASIENRFAQEDRELGLDQIFSYHNGGQELACLIGLFVWNYQLAAGMRLHPDERRMPDFTERRVQLDERPVIWEETEESRLESPPDPPEPAEGAAPPAETGPSAVPTSPADPDAETRTQPSARPPLTDPEHALATALSELPWAEWEKRNPGWRFLADECALECLDGQRLSPTHIRIGKHASILFRAASHTCPSCPARGSCMDSQQARPVKLKSISLPLEQARAIQPLLEAVLAQRSASRRKKAPPGKVASQEDKPARRRRPRRLMPLTPADDTVSGGPHAVSGPFIDLARARRDWRWSVGSTPLTVRVAAAPKQRPHPLLLPTREARRHARLTRTEKLNRYALAPDAEVQLTPLGGARLPTLGGWRGGFTFGPVGAPSS